MKLFHFNTVTIFLSLFLAAAKDQIITDRSKIGNLRGAPDDDIVSSLMPRAIEEYDQRFTINPVLDRHNSDNSVKSSTAAEFVTSDYPSSDSNVDGEYIEINFDDDNSPLKENHARSGFHTTSDNAGTDAPVAGPVDDDDDGVEINTTSEPTEPRSENPTEEPTEQPTEIPSEEPTERPTPDPTVQSTNTETTTPTLDPSESPTFDPSSPIDPETIDLFLNDDTQNSTQSYVDNSEVNSNIAQPFFAQTVNFTKSTLEFDNRFELFSNLSILQEFKDRPEILNLTQSQQFEEIVRLTINGNLSVNNQQVVMLQIGESQSNIDRNSAGYRVVDQEQFDVLSSRTDTEFFYFGFVAPRGDNIQPEPDPQKNNSGSAIKIEGWHVGLIVVGTSIVLCAGAGYIYNKFKEDSKVHMGDEDHREAANITYAQIELYEEDDLTPLGKLLQCCFGGPSSSISPLGQDNSSSLYQARNFNDLVHYGRGGSEDSFLH